MRVGRLFEVGALLRIDWQKRFPAKIIIDRSLDCVWLEAIVHEAVRLIDEAKNHFC
jgi:hypothetical protein